MNKPKNTFEMERLKESNSIQTTQPNRRTLFTIQFGALTRWILDISLIVLVWKIINTLP